jgi:hypothetical protein
MDETEDVDLRNQPVTILQEGLFSFMTYSHNKGKPRISSITLKFNNKLYQFEISNIKVITNEPFKDLKE